MGTNLDKLGSPIILNIYCRGVRPSNICLCKYWAGGPIQGHEVVREWVNIIRGVHVSK